MSGLLDALRDKHAASDPHAPDPLLRGRTYAIPFDTVWQAALAIIGGGIRGWSLIRSNDQAGTIVGLVQPGPLGKHADLAITIGLDEMAQTRVDFSATSRTERGDLGRARRILIRFFQQLDEKLGATPAHILDPDSLDALAASVEENDPASTASTASEPADRKTS